MKHIVKITTMSVYDTEKEALRYATEYMMGDNPEPNADNIDFDFLKCESVCLITENCRKPTILEYVEIPD